MYSFADLRLPLLCALVEHAVELTRSWQKLSVQLRSSRAIPPDSTQTIVTMVALSKVYHPPLNRIRCSELLMHQGCSCTQWLLWSCYRNLMSSAKYFLPLAISPLALKANKLKRQTVLDILKHYVEVVVWGSLASAVSFYCICLLRAILGKFYKYSATFFPGLIGFQLAWLFPKRSLQLFSTGTSQAALETLIYHLDIPLTRTIIKSKLLQTSLFMFASAVILHFKRANSYHGFWFIQPTPLAATEKIRQPTAASYSGCTHNGTSCRAFILDGMKSMLFYGIPLDILSVITKGKPPRNVGDVGLKLKMLRFNMTAFFLSYVGIYRFSTCALAHRFSGRSGNLQHFISAFVSGASYIFLGKLTVCTLSIVLAVQASWQHYCNQRESAHNHANPKTFSAFVKKIPFANLVLQLNLAYLIHTFVFHNYAVSKLGKGFLRGLTDNRIQKIYDHILAVDVPTLLRSL